MSRNSEQKTLESMSQAIWYNQWTLKKFEPFLRGEILEVGCGIGNFTNTLAKYGSVWAIDINKNYLGKLKKKLGDKVRVGYGDIEMGNYFFKNQTFDTIVCLNVLEHIKEDNKALENLYQILNSGGNLILLIPAYHSLYGNIDKAIGHFRRYTKEDLKGKLEFNKFNIRLMKVLNFLGAIGWFIAGKILKNKLVGESKIKVFNYIAPAILKIEDIVEPPFGTSLLIVAQKS